MNIFHGSWWWSWRFLGTFQCWDHIGVLFPPIFATGIQMLASQCFIHDILVLLCLRTFYPLLCYIKYSTLFIFLFRADLRLKKIKRKGHEIGLLITLGCEIQYYGILLLFQLTSSCLKIRSEANVLLQTLHWKINKKRLNLIISGNTRKYYASKWL